MLVTEYLKTNSLSALRTEHGVKSRFSACGRKISLNYDQIESDPRTMLHRECRGLIVQPIVPLLEHERDTRPVGEVAIVARPMPRFFNAGDDNAAQIDWNDPTLKIQEKLDGTMCAVYYDQYARKWCVATRSVPEADLKINDSEHTFTTLFMHGLDMTLGSVGAQQFFNTACKEYTYVFELTSPINRVVVEYPNTSVTLLAVRHNATGTEFDIALHAFQHRLPVPNTWTIRNLDALTLFVDNADPTKLEGAVVVDSKFNRVKIKNKTYVTVSKSKDVLASRRNVLELIIQEKLDDVIVHLEQQFREKLLQVQDTFRTYLKKIDERFSEWRSRAETRKDFARFVVASNDITQVYFALWENKHSCASDWFKSQHAAKRVTTSLLDNVLQQMYGNIPSEETVTRE